MTDHNIDMLVRHSAGKGAARSLRRQGRVPGVIYGGGAENVSVSFDPRELGKATDPAKAGNTLYTVTLKDAGKPDASATVMMTEIQRNPLKADFVHVDFMRVDVNKEITRTVPVEYTGRSVGVAAGGKLKKFLKEIKVAAKPGDIPVSLNVDLTPLDSGQTMRISDCKIPNARIVANPQQPVALVEIAKAKAAEGEGDDKDAAKKK